MERKSMRLGIILTILVFQETFGVSIRNELLEKCLQLQEARPRGRLTMAECNPTSALQEWYWHPETQALSSLLTGECLSVLRGQEHEGVRLHSCGVGVREREFQLWGCSKKGHLTLQGKGLHLSVGHHSAKVFLSKERGKGSKWRTPSNHTVCDERRSGDHGRHRVTPSNARPSLLLTPTLNDTIVYPLTRYAFANPMEDGMAPPNATYMNLQMELFTQSYISTSPENPSMAFFSLEYGMSWKVAMLVLSSLALVLGLVILLFNIRYNRKKKVVCVLNSFAQSRVASQQGSPVPNERAPLTQNPMRPPVSPSLQRGEILIEWKDGTVTPLFDKSTCFTN